MSKPRLLVPLLLVSIMFGCAGNGDDGVTGPTTGQETVLSTLRVRLTDKPTQEVQAVNVTILAVRVHQSSGAGEAAAGWVELPVTAAMPVDLLKLQNGVLYELCQVELPVGHYQQIRLELAPNAGAEPPLNQSVVTADGETHPLDVPSGTIKIVHGISVEAGKVTELTLDFDAAQSVKQRGDGTFFVKPVITAASQKEN